MRDHAVTNNVDTGRDRTGNAHARHRAVHGLPLPSAPRIGYARYVYSTCLFCNRPLGSNTVLEEFPVGRRLAFDGRRGRLWVVCNRCERWNLSPIEERWEAIEACERLFRSTRMRVSTENVGLARHLEGLELVRIGEPLRPEFAAWRYGDQFGRRRRRAILYGAAAAAGLGVIAIGGLATGVISGSILAQSGNFVNLWVNGRTRLRLATDEGKVLSLKLPDLQGARLRPVEDVGWAVAVGKGDKERVFSGDEAERVTGLIMPKLNASGARSAAVQDAVRAIEAAGAPELYLLQTVQNPGSAARTRLKLGNHDAALGKLPLPTRLALEMALHEEQERCALEGELKALEIAWKAAEEVAGIADDLLLPEETRAALAQYRRSRPSGSREATDPTDSPPDRLPF
jgi:hypothetical protein